MVRGRIIETFNTHQMSDEVVRQLQTARDQEVKDIMKQIRTELQNPNKTRQHFVVYGPRGSGKSFLMRLIDLEVKELQKAGEEIRFVLLPEEQYNIRSAPRLIQIIATYLRGADWSETSYRIDLRPEDQVWQESVEDLKVAIDQVFGSGRGLVVVAVENFDQLLVKMFGAGTTKGKKMQEGRIAEERLRGLISERGIRLMLIATATGTVDQDYERPLFEAFRDIDLKPWTPEDYLAYFNRRRTLDNRSKLSTHEQARTLAISQFTGGNPRLAQLLYNTLNAENMLDITSVLDTLADELADYYKSRIEDLPETSAGLLDALIRGGEPESQSGLAERVGAEDQNRIADSFRYLKSARLLSASKQTGGKASLYRVSDRLFVYFYRRRYGDPDAANPLVRITELLESFLSDVEKEDQALNHLEQGDPISARVYMDLLSSGKGYYNYSDGGIYRAHSMLKDLLDEEPNFLSSGQIQEEMEMLRNKPENVFIEWRDKLSSVSEKLSVDAHVTLLCLIAIAAARSRFINKASEYLKQAHDLAIESQDPDSLILVFGEMAMFSWYVKGDKESSIGFVDKAGQLARSSTKQSRLCRALLAFSFLQGSRGEHEAVVETAEVAVDLANRMGNLRAQAVGLRYKAYSLGQLNQHQEAVATADLAADLAAQVGDISEQAESLCYKAYSLGQLHQHQEAVATAEVAADLAAQVGDISEQAVSLRHKAYSLGQLHQHQEAVATAEVAADLAAQVGDISEQAVSLRHKAYSLGQLHQHQEAVATAEVAADLAAQVGDISEQAVSLRLKAYSLGQLNQHQEAATVASYGLTLALKADDLEEANRCLDLLLLEARELPFSEAIPQVENYLTQTGSQLDDRTLSGYTIGNMIIAVAQTDQWSDLQGLISRHQDSFSKSWFGLFHGVGKIWVERSERVDRAEFYSHIAEALPIIAKIMCLLPAFRTRGNPVAQHLQSLIAGFSQHCSNPGVLRDLGDLIREVFGEEGEIPAQELEAFAHFHASGRTEASLEKMDPDMATAIRRIWNLDDPEDILQKRLQDRRRKGRSGR